MTKPSTRQEVLALHEVWRKAEIAFQNAYTNQARVLGVRPGDFRYMRDRHNGTVLRLADEFVAAGDAWRIAFRARNQADTELANECAGHFGYHENCGGTNCTSRRISA